MGQPPCWLEHMYSYCLRGKGAMPALNAPPCALGSQPVSLCVGVFCCMLLNGGAGP